uniref:Nuclear receptor subfamily 1 group I member 3 n=1 Tax=Canis lupus familiaris TaxID=9615 RepID=A0A8C0P6B7_CANLF
MLHLANHNTAYTGDNNRGKAECWSCGHNPLVQSTYYVLTTCRALSQCCASKALLSDLVSLWKCLRGVVPCPPLGTLGHSSDWPTSPDILLDHVISAPHVATCSLASTTTLLSVSISHRRTVSKSTGLTCPFAGSCKVNKAQRRHCPACRLQKCLDAGMRKEMILSAEALALRRAKQAQRRAQQAPLQLSKEQKELVQTLLGAHTRHVRTMFDQFVQFRPPAHLFTHYQRLPIPVPVMPLLVHLADINTFMVQQVIKFTKDLPLFRSLPMEDQISLLKGAAVEICHIALNTTFCLQTRHFLCGPLRYTMEDGVHAGFQEEFLELLFRFHGTLKRLQLQEPEYVLLAAMALFSPDRPGVTRREEIDHLQEVMALTLQSYIRGQQPRPRDRFLYAKLLGLLAELRSINNAYGHQIQHIQGLSAMMPLLQEICS